MTDKDPQEGRLASALQTALAARLSRQKPKAEVAAEGRGAHWHVTASASNRVCKIDCYHHEPAPGPGAEYLIVFKSAEGPIAQGRTNDFDAIVESAATWLLKPCTKDDLYRAFSYVDENRRALEACAAQLEAPSASGAPAITPVIERNLGGDRNAELWSYHEERGCLIEPERGTDALRIAFLQQGTQLGRASWKQLDPARRALHAWLQERCSLSHLRELGPIEPAVGALEFAGGDIAGWHWKNLMGIAREQGASESPGACGEFLPLLERFAADDTVRKYFPYTRTHYLLWSRCSHYPKSGDGLPRILRLKQGYQVTSGKERFELGEDDAFEFVRTRLAQDKISPFHGTRDMLLIDPFNTLLVRQGSPLRVRTEFRRQWTLVKVGGVERHCSLQSLSDNPEECAMYLFDGPDRRAANLSVHSKVDAVRAIRMWIEDRSSVDDIATQIPNAKVGRLRS